MPIMAKKKHPKVMAGTRLEPGLHAAISAMADEERRNIAQMIAILLEEAAIARARYQRPKKPKGES